MDLIALLWERYTDKLAERYPIAAGVPLLLLPVFVMAGIIYLLAN